MHIIKISKDDRHKLKSVLSYFSKPKLDVDIFYNMCFCLCTPQTTFKKNRIVINRLISNGFMTLDIDQENLSEMIKEVRFMNNKAKWLLEARNNFGQVLSVVRDDTLTTTDKRRWLVKNIKGFGMKTASHFLRNLGCTDLAIIDTHILKFMGVSVYPITQRIYEDIEVKFISIAKKNNLLPVEFDAYIWKEYSGTPWVEFDW